MNNATWKKHFTYIPPSKKFQNQNAESSVASPAAGSKFSSYLPEVYAGQPQRRERYNQYDVMDADAEVNVSLDTIAEFCTQTEEQNPLPFTLEFNEDISETETTILHESLRQWVRLNKFNQRIFKIFRNTIKYGDQFFIRDPETNQWLWIDPAKVRSIIVNQAKGKKPEHYIVTDLDPNMQSLAATTPPPAYQQTTGLVARSPGPLTQSYARGDTATGRYVTGSQLTSFISSDDIVHISLSDGMDNNWPFGNSILEAIYKVYKQKELLEDSIIIYRVQRAPERRVFYIDVGNMPTHKAMAFVERVKNEIHQRRIPNRTGGGSSVMDASYNPLCLSLDTRIPLLDGRTLTLNELIVEYANGRENWTYSIHPETGEIVPGNITWAGITRTNTKVIKLILDNGKTLICTPDHKIPVWGKGYIEAKDILPIDSLMSFETRNKSLSTIDRDYVQVFDHKSKKWVFSHRLVGNFFKNINKHQEFTYLEENKEKLKTIIHHKDFNRFNNDPRNLQWMNKQDHLLYHSYLKQDYWKNAPATELARIKNKISNTLKIKFNMLSEAEKEVVRNKARTAQQLFVEKRKNDEAFAEKYNQKSRERRIEYFKTHQDHKNKWLASAKTWQENKPNQNKVYTHKMLQIIHNLAQKYNYKLIDIVKNEQYNEELLNEIRSNNKPDPSKKFKIQTNQITKQVILITLQHFGYKNWKDFKSKANVFNHKVVSIEWLSEKIDTGTITIDGKEKWHGHHNFAVDSGIFVKNSMLEDFFFATTAEGRGSKVETLPGGDQLGQIDDLLYFDNKLRRGLRIPSSYLPGGAEDGNTTYTDGRVGTAYIQEYRFAKFCKRLQELLTPSFDHEFKLYIKKKGINIDTSVFELRFNEPQSFSKYRQIEIDSAQINVFQPLSDIGYFSKRFLLKRFLNLKENEILENEKLWKEENPDKTGRTDAGVANESNVDLGDVGVGGGDFGADDLNLGEEPGGEAGGELGGEAGGELGGAAGGEPGGEITL